MSIISEKVSYLRGLAEGMKIDVSTNEGKLFTEMISVLGEIADDIEYLEDSQDELFDRVFDLEDDVYEDEDDEDYDDEEEEPFSVKCPACNEDFFVDEDDLESEEEIACPNCGQVLELEFDCDCGCDCDCEDEE